MPVQILQSDITTLPVDIIVNAANQQLAGGWGVDGAIHAAAGPELLRACQQIVQQDGDLPTGQAVITPGYDLPAQRVIHTVWPIRDETTNPTKHDLLLASCYTTSLDLAVAHDAQTIAFPNISTGVYGFPAERAVNVVANTIDSRLQNHPDQLEEIIFACFNQHNYELYLRRFGR